MKDNKIIIQGYPGSYHDVATHAFFAEQKNVIIPADSFSILGSKLKADNSIAYGVMAIENSIAGSILQNYRILRENNFNIKGEIYLRIEHCLMCLAGQNIQEIEEVHSHPMAINQCRSYFKKHPHIKLVDTLDTALAAKNIQDNKLRKVAAIASHRASELYDLSLLEKGIEDNKQNYTRFFVVQREGTNASKSNKASIWARVNHTRGSLLKLLQVINDHNINLSKLQSFPVLGQLSEYFFHMDLEYDSMEQFDSCEEELMSNCLEYKILGHYKKANISAALRHEQVTVMI